MSSMKQISACLAILISTNIPVHGMHSSDNIVASSLTTNANSDVRRWYKSQFVPPNKSAEDVLVTGQILAPGEKPHHMVERVVNTIASTEESYKELYHQDMLPTAEFAQQLGTLIDEYAILFGTPILTNAGRFDQRPLSACAMPPVDLKSDFKKIKSMVDKYHQDGMGTGYNLSDADDPIAILKGLNDVAVEGSLSRNEQRPVGNMAILDVDSPAIEQFVMAKVGADERGEEWKFNISVNITDDFISAVKNDREFTLRDGKKIEAKKLFEKMAYAAHQCGDPGLISIARLNKDNPTPLVGEYKCTAPCAEVGLAPGETCVFGYINLAKMVTNSEHPTVDFDRLKSTVKLLTRALDNALELSIQRYSFAESKAIMQAKRKIGIGICGLADMLISLNYSYQQKESRDLLQDILNVISYHSKEASVELGKYRGSFGGIANSRYMDESFLMDKYGAILTPHVSIEQWKELARNIKEKKVLRNATTSVLPPTGRSAITIGASTGVEPIFSFYSKVDGIYPALYTFLKKNSLADDPAIIKEIEDTGRCPKRVCPLQPNPYVSATELSPNEHLAMVIAAQKVIDESISKTINLPENITPQEIADIYMNSYEAGLKGISVFRNNSRRTQPKGLSKSADKPTNNK